MSNCIFLLGYWCRSINLKKHFIMLISKLNIEVREVVKTAELDGVKKVAKELKNLGVDIEIIIKSTGLSKQEIEAF